jgi:hypothetical protein
MEALEKKFKFGKIVDLMKEKEGTSFSGKKIKQLANYGFQHTMEEYVKNRLHPVELQRKVLKKGAGEVKLNASEESALRGALAALNWTAREGRPDASASASIFAGCFPEPTMADLFATNEAIRRVKEIPVVLNIAPIAEEEVRHVAIADSAFDPTGKTRPQHGWLLGITTLG